jgi:hypothetical protein
MELEMAKPTFARIFFCDSPYASMSPISIGNWMFLLEACHHMETSIL